MKFIPKALRTKLDSHAVPTTYLGIDSTSRAYILGSLYQLNTSLSIEVTFVEDTFPFHSYDNKDHYTPLHITPRHLHFRKASHYPRAAFCKLETLPPIV
jgi:hypothetical protein